MPCSRTISDRPLIQPTEEEPQANTQIIGPKRGKEEKLTKMNSERQRSRGKNIPLLQRENKKDVKIREGDFNGRLKEN